MCSGAKLGAPSLKPRPGGNRPPTNARFGRQAWRPLIEASDAGEREAAGKQFGRQAWRPLIEAAATSA